MSLCESLASILENRMDQVYEDKLYSNSVNALIIGHKMVGKPEAETLQKIFDRGIDILHDARMIR